MNHMQPGTSSARYPWKEEGKSLVLEAVRECDRFRFPYRRITVRENVAEGFFLATSQTLAPTVPPEQIGHKHYRTFATLPEACAWAEGISDEALGRC